MNTPPPSASHTEQTSLTTRDQVLSGVEHGVTPPSKTGAETIGEKKFKQRVYWGENAVGTFLFSVGAMYLFKHSASKSWFSPNKSWQEWWKHASETSVLGKDIFPAVALSMGGTAMAIPVKLEEDKKPETVHNLNVKYGTPEEVARGDANVADEHGQSWLSVAKGRLLAIGVVWGSLAGGNTLLKKAASHLAEKHPSELLKKIAQPGSEGGLGVYEAWMGKQFSKLATNGSEKTKEVLRRIGEITAVDAFATAAATVILMAGSAFFSRENEKRGHAFSVKQRASNTLTTTSAPTFTAPPLHENPEAHIEGTEVANKTKSITPREASFAQHALSERMASSNTALGV